MHTMNTSMWLDKVGAAFVSTVLIAALPTALVVTLFQALWSLAFRSLELWRPAWRPRWI